jgi:molybdenum cofactor synthesis domain-containing protein
MEVNLLGKTELWIKNITLNNVDLSEIARVVSETLKLGKEEVLVTDAGEDYIVIDILRNTLEAENIYGKKKELLNKLKNILGVKVSEETTIHSEGVLGFIELDNEVAREVIIKTNEILVNLLQKISRRCIIFSTGEEVRKGIVKDTNSPYIKERLKKEGFNVDIGPVLPDDTDLIASTLMNAVDDGYGLIITTGGVGAESKDRTIEALKKVDPEAATPYIMKFHRGTGRHEKDGVKIGVGNVGRSLIVSLPGPNDEVMLCMETLVEGLKKGMNKYELAGRVAKTLKNKYVSEHGGISDVRWNDY